MSAAREEPRLPEGVDEALELLLPGADARRRAEAERVADFLRLLHADAAREGEAVAFDLARARDDLARSGRGRLEDALRDLCAHHLAACAHPDRFLSVGAPERPAADAWRDLERMREEYDGLAELPAPAEPPGEVAARLVESLVRHAGEPAARVWRARLVAALEGPRAGEAAFRALAREVDTDAERAAALAGRIECLLDRGAVHPAADLAAEASRALDGNARLARLDVWCRLLAGDVEGARAVDERSGPWRGTLPGALSRLRRERPDWLPLLSGRAPARRASDAATDAVTAAGRDCSAECDRSADGAQLVAVVQLFPGALAECVAHDAAAALRPHVARALEDRERAAARPGTPEHRLVRDARPVAWHRAPDDPELAHSVGGADARAALLEPILDEAGEVCGWLRFECSHHLLPSPARAAALARAWRAELLRRRGRWEPADEPRALLAKEPADADRSDVARVFEDLVADLAIKTSRRAWWGFELDGDAPRLVASGGGGLGPPAEAPGRGRALRRALACGGPVRGEEPDPGLYLHAQSASGVALRLDLDGVGVGALVIESERRRDFPPDEAARLAQVAARWALPLRHAWFRARHRARFGTDVLADAASPGFAAFHRALVRAARAPAPLVLVGPPGAGKRVLARWAWCEAHPDAPPRPERAVEDRLDGGGGGRGAAYLSGVERLDARGQARLLRALEDGDARDVALGLRADPARAAREGRLAPELAAALGRERLDVPGFAARRDEVPGLAEARLAALARALGRPLPALAEDARAFLWRQDWAGNWRELDARLHGLLRRDRADAVGAEELDALWRAAGEAPIGRLPSRTPPARLLRAALDATATAGGRANKRRAALYLGWDPDTLAARLSEAGIEAPDPARRGAAWRRGTGSGTTPA